ncbi:anthranilate phosphoribosyltransferase [Candidatus Blochmanniella vafra str. BVAF]|uniref:Anthranilate phosphoribosyltransferase n=1 Tax=Blochmanniella vafra (strain BVAF) TaxID=859654 RepID=E8Q6C4_BLOVB|nr:anthranilate phosphoribosyltransferase [Candidatus Blochmannia vafer]ADV33818.1 anthranilate phosphoribosyltransferase [Candidatus Blochmannia vafer str. BVAF]
MKHILNILRQSNNLTRTQCKKLFFNIINKKFSSKEISEILINIKNKGETIEEILGAADALLIHAKYFPKLRGLFADITGTGGDGKNTINISTASALIASTCGVKIVKHGNYNASSSIGGSMNLLQQYNVCINMNTHQILKNFNELGICFLCASQYYPILRDVTYIRKQLKTPTLFNIIGPLINPSKPPLTLIGVYKKELLSPITQTLKLLNYKRAIVVHCDGIDEVGLHNQTNVFELRNGTIQHYTLTPSDFGLKKYPLEELWSSSQHQSYSSIINVLKGQGKPSHTAVITANVALLLTLFGHNNLRSNTSTILNKIYTGLPYKKLLALSSSLV